MTKRFLVLVLSVAVASGLSSVTATPVAAHEPGQQGCTPGYWKNQTDNWPGGVFPSDAIGTYIPNASLYGLGGSSLLEVLGFRGGSDTDGAARILLRASVAGGLNAAHSGVNYPVEVDTILSTVNNLLAGGDRAAMLSAASQLDAFNNLECPLQN